MRILVLLGLLGLAATPLAAQEAFEIEVYPYATAHRGEWELEAYLNLASRGTKAFDGAVAPTNGQWRFAAELTRGITDYWEVSGYLLGAHVPDFGFEYAGWRLRSRVRAPERWHLPVNVGFAAEYETARPMFAESEHAAEFTTIFERRIGGLQLIVAPAFERHLSGPERGEWELEPRARAGVAVSDRVTLGLEYHSVLGELGNFKPARSQVHQFFPTVDVDVPGDVELHFGIGIGATTAGDRLVFKTKFEMPLGGEQ
jgi:hypothetical protein